MKKRIGIILLLALTAMTLVACGKKEKESDAAKKVDEKVDENENGNTLEEKTEKSNIEDRTTFTVGFDAEFPPYGFMDEDGTYTGFDLELAEEVCKRRGWSLVKQPISWSVKDMELSSGAIDCIWNGFTINGREEEYTWTNPYVNNSQVFVVASNAGIASQADLAGKTVAVQSDSSALKALQGDDNKALLDSFNDLIEIAEYNTAFMDLEMGAVDAVAMDIGVAKVQIASRKEGEYKILDDYLSEEQYGIGFLLGETELKDAVESTLLEMVADGKFDEIAKKWDLQEFVCLGK